MAKERTTTKTSKRATRTENAKKATPKAKAKKADKPSADKPSAVKPAARKVETSKSKIAVKAAEPAKEKHSDRVTIDRRGESPERRKSQDRRKKGEPVAVEKRTMERRTKVNRRRQIDPTTCERDYTNEELEFMNALDEYKRTSGRMFPTCSEVLEVIRGLGYEKRAANAIDDNAKNEQLSPQQAHGQASEPPAVDCQSIVSRRLATDIAPGNCGTVRFAGNDDAMIDLDDCDCADDDSLDRLHATVPLDLEEYDFSERIVF